MKNKIISLAMLLLISTTTGLTAINIFDAAKKGDIEKVKEIINNNNDQINAQDDDGNTPLHLAASSDNRQLIKLLIEEGSNTDIKNYSNQTPLDFANEHLLARLRKRGFFYSQLSDADTKIINLLQDKSIRPESLLKKLKENNNPRDIIKKIDKEVISDEKIPEHIKTKAVNGLVKIAKKNSYLIGCVKNIVYKHPCSTEEVISFIFETNSPNKVFKNLLKRTKKIKDKKDGRKILDMITARAFLIKKYEATMPLEIIGKIMSYL